MCSDSPSSLNDFLVSLAAHAAAWEAGKPPDLVITLRRSEELLEALNRIVELSSVIDGLRSELEDSKKEYKGLLSQFRVNLEFESRIMNVISEHGYKLDRGERDYIHGLKESLK